MTNQLPDFTFPTFTAWWTEMKKFLDPIDVEMKPDQARFLYDASERTFRPIIEKAKGGSADSEAVRIYAKILLGLKFFLWFSGMAYLNVLGLRGRMTREGRIAIAVREEIYGIEP